MILIPGMQKCIPAFFYLLICKSINVIQHINRIKHKRHMIISIDVENPLTKFNTLYVISPEKTWN
jgi:hypothetical protein